MKIDVTDRQAAFLACLLKDAAAVQKALTAVEERGEAGGEAEDLRDLLSDAVPPDEGGDEDGEEGGATADESLSPLERREARELDVPLDIAAKADGEKARYARRRRFQRGGASAAAGRGGDAVLIAALSPLAEQLAERRGCSYGVAMARLRSWR